MLHDWILLKQGNSSLSLSWRALSNEMMSQPYPQSEATEQGPVVQSVASLTSLLKVISLTVLVDSIHNILIFFAEKMWVAFAKATHIFSAKKFSIFAYHSIKILTNC